MIIGLIILGITYIFYLPILINPNILTGRGNDLTEFFFPIIYFVRNSILHFHQLPLWNTLFFSGTPLLPDPQAPIFYLPNIIFLFLNNIDAGFVVSVFIHIFIAGCGMYLLAKRGFMFSESTSIFCSLLYIFSPKLSGYIEAGHYGLITSWGWLPFCFFLAISLGNNPTLKKSVFLGIALALVFYTHVLIFVITVIAVSFVFLYYRKNLTHLIIAGLICFGLIAIAFIPQLNWQSQTTRNLLLNNPDVYPKWQGMKEFLKASITPLVFGPKFIWNLDTEKTIALGFFTLLFAAWGFVKTRRKLILVLIVILVTLVSLNNVSPIYDLLISQKWYILLRVSTRLWFLEVFVVIYLAGKGLEDLSKNKSIKPLIYILIILAIGESLLTSWTKILKPVIPNTNLAGKEVYEFLSKDKDIFRVFCLNRCLSQKEAALYNLELGDGYGTLQQMNYYIFSEQLSQAFYRNKYTLSIPPFEIFEYENLQPYSPDLASYRIKYVISDHTLKDKNLIPTKLVGKYLIYQNKLFNNPSYIIYSPNFIRAAVSSSHKDLIIPEVFNNDWHAFANGNNEIKISETSEATRKVELDSNIEFVDFRYEPFRFVKIK